MSAGRRGGPERAGVLAAGEGSRLRATALPKPLVRVAGVPLIEWTVRGLVQAGARSVACVVNERFTQVEPFLLEGDFGAEIRVVARTTKSSLFSLLALRPFLEEGPFLLATTDTVLPLRDWEAFGRAAAGVGMAGEDGRRLDALLGVTPFVQDENPLWVQVDENGTALALGPRAQRGGLVTSGVYAFHPSVFDEALGAAASSGGRLRHFLERLAGGRRRIATHRFAKAVDVDRAEDLESAERLLREEGRR